MRGLHIVDVSDPQNPFEAGFWETNELIYDVAVYENYAFVVDIYHSMFIIDISDPEAPVQAAVETIPSGARYIRIFGSHAYVFDQILTILDLADPLQPEYLGTYNAPQFEGFLRDLEVVGNYAYLLGPTWLRAVDVSDPASPAGVGVYNTAYEAYNMAMLGTHVYVNEFSNGMEVIDVSDPSAPALLGTLDMDNDIDPRIRDVAASGNYAFVSDDDLDLHVIDVSDPIHAQHFGWHSTAGYGDNILLADNLAYVCDRYRIEIFDVSAATPVGESLNPLVSEFALHPIYPNPFNSTANISFDLPREVTGKLVVYDVLGREANILYNGRLASGSHQMQFNANGLSSGLYFVKLESPDFTATQKAVLLK